MVVGDFAIELDTVVIGAGPGGYVAAIRAAEMGQKVAVIEKEYVGGVCLNIGCIPSKALIQAGHKFHDMTHSDYLGVQCEQATLDFSKTQEWKQSVVTKLTDGVHYLFKKHNIELIEGEAFFVDEHQLRVINGDHAQSYSFNNAIVATGSRPIEIPGFAFEKRVLDSTGALNLTEVPRHLIIIGGGVIGVELGTAYRHLGSDVTILEGVPRLLSPFDKDMTDIVTKRLEAEGISVITNARAIKSEQTETDVTVTYSVDGNEQQLTGDYVLVAVGRRPNTDDLGLDILDVAMDDRGFIDVDNQGRTSVPSLWAIGDIVKGAALAHKASYEGKVAAEAISGKKGIVDYKAMPAVAFCDPEIATTGLQLMDIEDQKQDYRVTKFALTGNGRALSLNDTAGFIRLIVRKSDNVVVGGQVVGPNASDLITEITLAIEAGMNDEDLALTIHPHPSLSEAIMDTAEASTGYPIHM